MEKKKRVRSTKIGDVFSVSIDEYSKKYLQYIISDLTQLNSDVVRAFKKSYPNNYTPDLPEIISDEVDFYSHCCTRAGLKRNLWVFIGNSKEVGNPSKLLFRSAIDLELIKPDVSYNWWVWCPNGERKYVGKLPNKYKMAEIGVIPPPQCIVHRMITGELGFKYSRYE